MKKEVLAAVNFLVDLLRLSSDSSLKEDQLLKFRDHVCECLWGHYKDHWFPEKPLKGSAYRCIRINGKMDPLISQAGALMGMSPKALRSLFPSELTMWVDPREVSYRIGENGSICVLFTPTGQTVNSVETEVGQQPKPIQPPTPAKSPPEVPSSPLSPLQQKQSLFTPSKTVPSTPPPFLQSRQSPSPRSTPIHQHPNHHHNLLQQQQQQLLFLMNSQHHAGGGHCKDSLRNSNLDSVRGIERLYVSS